MLMNRRAFLLASASVLPLPAAAQNSFLTPGGASVPGIVTMCLSGGTAIPCSPSPPVLTAFIVTAPATATSGTPFNFTVTAVDQFNNPFPGYAGTVHFTSSDGTANLPADTTLVAGTGTFPATLNAVGTWTITATDTVTPAITGTSAGIVTTAPVFPPVINTNVQPAIYADFTTEGTTNRYWASGAAQAGFAAWATAIGCTPARASAATFHQGGVVKTALANVMRFPSDVSGVPLGIRTTGSTSNTYLHSEFDSASFFTLQGAGDTLTPNAVLAPDATTTTGAAFVPAAASAQHNFFLTSLVNQVLGQPYTMFVFCQPNGFTNFQLDPDNNGGGTVQFSCVGAGTATPVGGSVTGSGILAMAGGWYLCWTTFTQTNATGNRAPMIYCTGNAASRVFLGNATSGYNFWGCQISNLAFLPDYVKTTTVTATQAADDLHSTVAWYNAPAGTLFGDSVFLNPGNAAPAFSAIWDSGVSQNIFDIRAAAVGTLGLVQSGGAAQWTALSGPAVVAGVRTKAAMGLIAGSFSYSKNNGTPFLTQASGIMPVAPTRLAIGNNSSGVAAFANHRTMGYWPARATDPELLRITT